MKKEGLEASKNNGETKENEGKTKEKQRKNKGKLRKTKEKEGLEASGLDVWRRGRRKRRGWRLRGWTSGDGGWTSGDEEVSVAARK